MEGGALFNPGFLGGSFLWWVGQIPNDENWRENINPGKFKSPDEIPGWGYRYKVRIIGLHDQDQVTIKSDQLPWAQVMYPITAGGGQGGSFQTPAIKQGNFVFGFFLDGQDQQVPVIMGVLGANAQIPKALNKPTNQPFTSQSGYSGSPPDVTGEKTSDDNLVASRPSGTSPGGQPTGGDNLNNPPTPKAVPTKESPSATHQESATDTKIEEVLDRKHALSCPNPAENSAMKGIQTVIENLQKKIEKFQKSLKTFSDAVSLNIKNAMKDINKALEEASKEISKFMKEIYGKIQEFITDEYNKALKPLEKISIPTFRIEMLKLKIEGLEKISCLFNKLAGALEGLLKKGLSDSLKNEAGQLPQPQQPAAEQSLPKVTLSLLSGPTGKTSDLIIGEKITGANSRAIAVVAERLSDSQITYISLNKISFKEGETVTFEKSKIQAIIGAQQPTARLSVGAVGAAAAGLVAPGTGLGAAAGLPVGAVAGLAAPGAAAGLPVGAVAGLPVGAAAGLAAPGAAAGLPVGAAGQSPQPQLTSPGSSVVPPLPPDGYYRPSCPICSAEELVGGVIGQHVNQMLAVYDEAIGPIVSQIQSSLSAAGVAEGALQSGSAGNKTVPSGISSKAVAAALKSGDLVGALTSTLAGTLGIKSNNIGSVVGAFRGGNIAQGLTSLAALGGKNTAQYAGALTTAVQAINNNDLVGGLSSMAGAFGADPKILSGVGSVFAAIKSEDIGALTSSVGQLMGVSPQVLGAVQQAGAALASGDIGAIAGQLGALGGLNLNIGKAMDFISSVTTLFECDPEPKCSPNDIHTLQDGGNGKPGTENPNSIQIAQKAQEAALAGGTLIGAGTAAEARALESSPTYTVPTGEVIGVA